MAVRTWDGNDATTPYDWSVSGNWLEGSVPVSTDDVVIPSGSAKITAGLNQSAVTLASLVFEDFDQDVGSSTGYLQVGVSGEVRFDLLGGQQFINLGSSSVSPIVNSSGGATSGQRALNIIGSALSTLVVNGGSVGVALDAAQSATVTTVKVLNGDVWLGENATVTTLYLTGGTVRQQCATTTTELNGGSVRTVGTGTIGTLNVYGGMVQPESTGTITTANLYGGTIDASASKASRTITTLNILAQSIGNIRTDPDGVTISTLNLPTDRKFSLSVNP